MPMPHRRYIKIYMSILFPALLDEPDTWSLTLRKEQILKIFENRVLKIIF
jgi:hypothetical protein